jgi:hypothetical protein
MLFIAALTSLSYVFWAVSVYVKVLLLVPVPKLPTGLMVNVPADEGVRLDWDSMIIGVLTC